ncbi:MAG: dihydropteroate synthase [Holosporaceae bacterium]|jgi:2-amino-4-hydroxy-6-hydroxymethyldihydropteridine diphosphokinase/dihydropteroate synthase|nr:dihydropteroate synthase [Holosporaceae bacterium]
MIYLSLGSNLGNRIVNLRTAIAKISLFFDCEKISIVIETRAILPQDAPADWDKNYLNVVIGGNTFASPFELLSIIKNIEKEMGRDASSRRWSPRIIDIDIITYHDQYVDHKNLSIPHKEIQNRDCLQYLLASLDYEIPQDIRMDVERYSALNYFTLEPKLVGIVNVTPDSFSDGGDFFDTNKAIEQINELYRNGASVIELGAQSTRPGYMEVSPAEEISRLSKILERVVDLDCIGVDTYFDDVVKYALQKPNINWINDIKSQISDETIKMIADRNIKYVTMLQGTDIFWLRDRAKYLRELGIARKNIILDPGIGFAKTKRENIEIIKNISVIQELGYEVLLGHSRKSFISAFSNSPSRDRDIETLAISDFARQNKVDYLRVHNIKDHMKFFVAKHRMTNN